MAGDYLIHFHDLGEPKKPMAKSVFPDFATLVRFITENKTDDWANSVSVHLPAHASDTEREKIKLMGFRSNWA